MCSFARFVVVVAAKFLFLMYRAYNEYIIIENGDVINNLFFLLYAEVYKVTCYFVCSIHIQTLFIK